MRPAIAVLAIVLHASVAAASGSYVRPSLHRAGLDDYPKYELGKSVSQGRIALPGPDSELMEQQQAVLAGMESQLPRNTRIRLDLSALAGRLDPDQLDAIRYYLRVRYRIR